MLFGMETERMCPECIGVHYVRTVDDELRCPNCERSPDDDADAWMCHACGFLWSGRNRPPPYPWCPECDVSFVRRLRVSEVPLAEAGFIPSRIHVDA